MDCNQGEGKRKGESKPNIEVSKKVQWAAKVQASIKTAHSLIQRDDSDNKWQQSVS